MDGIGSHQSAKMMKDEWLTPPEVVQDLGPFDLDPCAPIVRPWDTAAKHYTIEDDGLHRPWYGSVWCNPPYGKQTAKWLQKCAKHNNCMVLMFARTETRMFFKHVWKKATALLFIQGRLHFHHVDGVRAKANSGAPSVLIAYGSRMRSRLAASNISGHLVLNNKNHKQKGSMI